MSKVTGAETDSFGDSVFCDRQRDRPAQAPVDRELRPGDRIVDPGPAPAVEVDPSGHQNAPISTTSSAWSATPPVAAARAYASDALLAGSRIAPSPPRTTNESLADRDLGVRRAHGSPAGSRADRVQRHARRTRAAGPAAARGGSGSRISVIAGAWNVGLAAASVQPNWHAGVEPLEGRAVEPLGVGEGRERSPG